MDKANSIEMPMLNDLLLGAGISFTLNHTYTHK